MKKVIFIILILSLGNLALSQERHIDKAKDRLKENDYYHAAQQLEQALELTELPEKRKELMLQIAETYMAMNYFWKAVPYYQNFLADGRNEDPEAYKQYGIALMYAGKEKEAYEAIEQALSLENGNNDINALAEKIEQYRLDSLSQPYNPLTPVDELNTAFSEYGPAWVEDRLLFASTRVDSAGQQIDGRTGQGFSRIFTTSYDSSRKAWKEPVNISRQLKTQYNAGTFSYDKYHNSGYYMECNRKHSSCKLYKAKFQEGEWSKGKPVHFNKNTYSIGHPALTANGRYMYFVSDMAGGRGGRDIYVTRKKAEDNWTLPVNAGKAINSDADEMFPYVLGDSLLFFASTRQGGYGGLDLYCSWIREDKAGEPVHLSKPFNSMADDFSVLLHQQDKGGFFISNRNYKTSDDIFSFPEFPVSLTIEGRITEMTGNEALPNAFILFTQPGEFTDTIRSDSNGHYSYPVFQPYTYYDIKCVAAGFHAQLQPLTITDSETIYKKNSYKLDFQLKKAVRVTLAGKVLNRENKAPMEGESLKLSGTNGIKKITQTNPDGSYRFTDLPTNAAYTVRISKEGYFAESRECVVPNVEETKVFSKDTGCDMDFLLTKIQQEKEIVLQDIYYDFDKASLRPQSKKELDKLVSMLKETPRVVIRINSHTDSRGSDAYNMGLSQRRAKTVVDYLTKKGIEPERLTAKGYGENNPVISEAATESEHQLNRRTSFNILEVKKISSSQQKELAAADASNNLSFRVQLLVSRRSLDTDEKFKDILKTKRLGNVMTTPTPKGLFRYEAGPFEGIDEARKAEKQIQKLGYKDAFLVAYHKGEKISVKKAMEMIGKKSVKLK